MKCTFLKYRSKKQIKFLWCNALKKEIKYVDCNGCKHKEYKKIKSIKKVSKKRIVVSEKSYNIVFEKSKGKCALCDKYDNLQYHHIYYRSERKDLIDDPTNGIMLCHKDFSKNKCHQIVHNNKKKYQPILLEIKKKLNQ